MGVLFFQKSVQFLKIVHEKQGDEMYLENLIIKTNSQDNLKFNCPSQLREYFFCHKQKSFKAFLSDNFLCISRQKLCICTTFRIYKPFFVWYQLFLRWVQLKILGQGMRKTLIISRNGGGKMVKVKIVERVSNPQWRKLTPWQLR